MSKKRKKAAKPRFIQYWHKFWYFIWEDDSIWSWIANIILAFLLIKFIIYPGLGLALTTTHPIVAVVSNSMEHNGMGFNEWYAQNSYFYREKGIYIDVFRKFDFKNGFNKGDIMFVKGEDAEDISLGDIIVFKALRKNPANGNIMKIDIIHRIVRKWEQDGEYYFQTKGDSKRNPVSIESYINKTTGAFLSPIHKNSTDALELLDETRIIEDRIIGKAVFRVPYLGWVKLWFVNIVKFLSTAIKTIF